MTRHAPVMIYQPGTELDCGPREDQLVILPGVAIEDFVGRIVECGFPHICHVHCKDPARHIKYGFPTGRVRMVFTDGRFLLPDDVSATDAQSFLDSVRLTQATYLSHVKTFETAILRPEEGDQENLDTQVVIVSTYTAPKIRQIFAAAGLDPRQGDLSFYRGYLL